MKKLILLLIVILPLSLSAQRFHGGLLAGMNVSQIDGDTWAGFSKAGFVGGAYVFTDFTEKWGAQLEIKYSSKGSASPKYSYDNIKFRLRYIEIPILANYNIVKKFAVHGGLSIGFLFRINLLYANYKITFLSKFEVKTKSYNIIKPGTCVTGSSRIS